jgi:hypothetical protein
MRKIWAIAWKELYVRFTDRNLMLIMIATPLAISTIVGLAFGGLGEEESPIQNIPVAVVNLDQGGEFGEDYGDLYASLLVPGEADADPVPSCEREPSGEVDGEADDGVITDLIDAVRFDSDVARGMVLDGSIQAPGVAPGSDAYRREAARAAVDRGLFRAAVIVQAAFSKQAGRLADPAAAPGEAQVIVYGDRGSPISTGVVFSVVDEITNRLRTGNIDVAATLAEMSDRLGPAAVGAAVEEMDFEEVFVCAFSPTVETVKLETHSLEGGAERRTATLIMVSVGSSQAIFFALFTAQFGVLSMYDERRNWTL